jgi:hypothetical protein
VAAGIAVATNNENVQPDRMTTPPEQRSWSALNGRSRFTLAGSRRSPICCAFLPAGAGDDELHGGDGDDILDGYSGKDQLYGEAGNDILDGGSDGVADLLVGGSGADPFRPDRSHNGGGWNKDKPTDFGPGDEYYGW